MHEISLVQNLFQQLKELAAENDASKINNVTMEIGPLSGVVIDSFQFGFDILSAEEDLLRGAKLIIAPSIVKYSCSGCGHSETIESNNPADKPDGCSRCDELLLIPDGGHDLLLLQVEME